MRDLAQPATLKSSVIAATMTALACYPRLALWTSRRHPLWYLEALILLGAIVLWAFVFAWHSKYARRPVITLNPGMNLFALASGLGILIAVALSLGLDPALRLRTPGDYPANGRQWIAITLFTLGFSQLFLIFAPFAWLLRLMRNRWAAAVLTVMFGILVLVIKVGSSTRPVPAPLLAGLLLVRVIVGSAALFLYWRGGLLLAWWLGLLIEARHLFHLSPGP